MKYGLGIALLPFAAWLLWQTYQDWQRVEAARAALPAGTGFTADDDTNPLSLAGIGEMVLPFVLAALVFSAFECIAVYRLVEGERSLSLFDMAVVLGTIAAYGLNFALKVKHRMPKTALAPRPKAQGRCRGRNGSPSKESKCGCGCGNPTRTTASTRPIIKARIGVPHERPLVRKPWSERHDVQFAQYGHSGKAAA